MKNNDSLRSRETLAHLFRKENGIRSCVPVFGTGLNLQAAMMEGYKDRDDWNELLRKIAIKINMSQGTFAQLPKTYLALWEAMLCGWASSANVYPYQAEIQLQNFVAEELKRQERECLQFQLYKNVATAGFVDIMSLNFDRRIGLSCKSHKFVTGLNPCPHGAHGESLFRHSTVTQSDGKQTRIWYPHGDVKKAATIKLGVRKYGFYVGVFREYLRQLRGEWRYSSKTLQHFDISKNDRVRRDTPTWVDLLLTRPLVFVGCGLSADEWPLWWLLRLRSSKQGLRNKTFCLALGGSQKPSPAHFNLLPNIQVVRFESPEELWGTFLSWISMN